MEDDLQILKFDYRSNHRSDLLQILNLPKGTKSKIKIAWNEDDLKILKVEYIFNHCSDLPQILNLRLGEQTKIKISWNEDDFQWKMTSNWRLPQNI